MDEGICSHTMATAPFSIEPSINLCPSAAAPFTAINKLPFCTLRESICTSATSRSVLPDKALVCTLYNISLSFFTDSIKVLPFDFFEWMFLVKYPVLLFFLFLLQSLSDSYSPTGIKHLLMSCY